MTTNGNQNARKHGAFSKIVILPSEDCKEFEELHQSLIEEWNIEGASERDKIFNVAKYMWLKRRSNQYFQNAIAKLLEKEVRQKRFQEKYIDTLITVLEEIEAAAPGSITEGDLSTKLSVHLADHLKTNYPRKNYDTDNDWLSAVTDVIYELIDKRMGNPDESSSVEEEFSHEEFTLRQLDIDNALDAKIDRELKQLGQIKTMKAMGLAKRTFSVASEPSRQIDAPAKLQVVNKGT
jgi:hypothetical protein